jgi:zinc protease
VKAGLPCILTALAFVSVGPAISALQQPWPTEGPPPPLEARRVDFPPYQLRTLSNGLRVLAVPHHEQPSVSFRLLLAVGAVQEPPDRPGLASFVATLLNQGTTSKSAGEIATMIDSAGGIIGVGSGNELTFIQGAIIKDRTGLALGLASDLAQNPAFAEQEIALQRKQALSALQVGYDDPGYLAGAVFNRLVFGSHPYGRPHEGTPESIPRITAADLRAFHRAWFVPNNALLAIVGDLTVEEAFAAAESAFGTWERREVPAIQVPDPPRRARRVVVVDRPGSAQTAIRVGHLSISRTHPDHITFDLAVRILGGEGANRLFGVLRSDRGLTYSASADLNTFRSSGVVVAETDTRTSSTGEALRLMVDEFARLRRNPVHPAELLGAQNFIKGHFPLSIETPGAIAEQVLARMFFGQDLAGIETYVDQVGRVTPADIQRVARELLEAEDLAIVLVGDAATFVDQIRALGFVDYERIPLSELDLNSPALRRGAPIGRSTPPVAGEVPPA